MTKNATIQLKEFCQLFGFPDRPVRFLLEAGYVPKGVEENPSTGNRREFGPRHAFWLAIAVYLRMNGMKSKTAVEVAELTVEGIRILSQNFGWDREFYPAGGWFRTQYQHYLDVADLTYIRLVTDSEPSKNGLSPLPWRHVKKVGEIKKLDPVVVLRLNISRIANTLETVQAWEKTD